MIFVSGILDIPIAPSPKSNSKLEYDNKTSEYLPTEEVLALRSNIGETTIRIVK